MAQCYNHTMKRALWVRRFPKGHANPFLSLGSLCPLKALRFQHGRLQGDFKPHQGAPTSFGAPVPGRTGQSGPTGRHRVLAVPAHRGPVRPLAGGGGSCAPGTGAPPSGWGRFMRTGDRCAPQARGAGAQPQKPPCLRASACSVFRAAGRGLGAGPARRRRGQLRCVGLPLPLRRICGAPRPAFVSHAPSRADSKCEAAER